MQTADDGIREAGYGAPRDDHRAARARRRRDQRVDVPVLLRGLGTDELGAPRVQARDERLELAQVHLRRAEVGLTRSARVVGRGRVELGAEVTSRLAATPGAAPRRT